MGHVEGQSVVRTYQELISVVLARHHGAEAYIGAAIEVSSRARHSQACASARIVVMNMNMNKYDFKIEAILTSTSTS